MDWLPIFFVGVMGFALLMYTILDGYDLGIGMLLPLATESEKDLMISTIGPFWDANETWLVLGVGVLLMAFPQAHSIVLNALYIPVTIMLLALMLRGAAFDFRVKVKTQYKTLWNNIFCLGSCVASMAQGWMLGRFVMGFAETFAATLFAGIIALMLPVLYLMLGSAWVLVKTEGELYAKAARWASWFVLPLGLGLFLISIITPIVSHEIAAKWFSLPIAIGLLPIPIASIALYLTVLWILCTPKVVQAGYAWLIFPALVILCLMCSIGLAYSLFPAIVLGQMTLWQAAAAHESLQFAFYGTIIAVPAIFAYTLFIYRVFAGKIKELSYEN